MNNPKANPFINPQPDPNTGAIDGQLYSDDAKTSAMYSDDNKVTPISTKD